MTAKPDPAAAPDARKPHIPRPPSKEEIDEISRDQALITDEWAPAPVPERPPEK